MFFNIQEKNITVNGIRMNYVAFGNGKIPLIILPGLGDGLKSVRGQSVSLAIFYREFAQKFRVYIFSRKNVLDEGYTTKDMAKDQKGALEKLGIDRFYLMPTE
ncbi:MAG: alpha/beta hydrolase [Tetragenococcus koreensis]|nr:alpha/beta hydrolase [Tetragenococcus koreensis]MDN6344929.1 alpha/beta hydrolase [Tetragenococcus koreensis]